MVDPSLVCLTRSSELLNDQNGDAACLKIAVVIQEADGLAVWHRGDRRGDISGPGVPGRRDVHFFTSDDSPNEPGMQ